MEPANLLHDKETFDASLNDFMADDNIKPSGQSDSGYENDEEMDDICIIDDDWLDTVPQGELQGQDTQTENEFLTDAVDHFLGRSY